MPEPQLFVRIRYLPSGWKHLLTSFRGGICHLSLLDRGACFLGMANPSGMFPLDPSQTMSTY